MFKLHSIFSQNSNSGNITLFARVFIPVLSYGSGFKTRYVSKRKFPEALHRNGYRRQRLLKNPVTIRHYIKIRFIYIIYINDQLFKIFSSFR